jgi:hypothetical protein
MIKMRTENTVYKNTNELNAEERWVMNNFKQQFKNAEVVSHNGKEYFLYIDNKELMMAIVEPSQFDKEWQETYYN